jgi:hypothetical protein
MDMKEIILLSTLLNSGKKIARLIGNRNLNEKIVKGKMESVKKYGQLVPAVIVEARVALEQGLEIEDFETGKKITEVNVEEYVVLVDANHRYEAHLRLIKANGELDKQYTKEFYLMYALNEGAAIAEILSEINVATNPWKGGDYVKGAVIRNIKEEIPLLGEVRKMIDENYSLTTASKWLTFTSDVNRDIMTLAMNGTIKEELRRTTGIDRGKKLLEVSKLKFEEKTLKSRIIIDWIISKYNNTPAPKIPSFTEEMERFIKNINEEDAKYINKAKGKRGGETREGIINRKLNELWENFNISNLEESAQPSDESSVKDTKDKEVID